jgi:TorA maturation chaperone TorD
MPDFDPDQAIALEDMCRYLAACYYEPAAEFAEEKLFDSLVNAAQRVDPALAAVALRLRDAFATQALEDLLVDHARLFLGPAEPLAKPYGSCWLALPAAGDSPPDILEMYREGGFEIDDELRDLPDHVAIELEFLYLTLFRRHEAQRSGDADALREITGLQQRLLSQHLGAWIAPFTGAVKANAQTAFYRDVAVLTERFVAMIAADPAPAAPTSLQ